MFRLPGLSRRLWRGWPISREDVGASTAAPSSRVEKDRMDQSKVTARRPIRARSAGWARAVARWLQRIGLRPNQVSLTSVAFAALAGVCLVFAPRVGLTWRVVLFLAAAGFIQLRLLCNLIDGMLAVEGGLKTKSGEVFNDLPDRVADAIVLVAAGYSAASISWVRELGWAAALLAVLTAYVRVLGGATGVSQHFLGPMAQPHRMALMTAACVVSAGVSAVGWSGHVMAAALGVVVAGCLVTIVRRVRRIVVELESK